MMLCLGYISPSVSSTLTPRLGNLGAPGDMYVITDTRQRSKKDLDEIKSLQRYQIEKYDGSDAAMQSENGVILFPVKDLHFDTVNFQNRDAEFSETSVNKIIDAVTWGEFNWAIFDPITIWRNPADGLFYVLSGHSRSEAFRRLSADGEMADGRNFDRIPAKIFNGTFEQAKELALNSNTLSTKETDLERANYYRTRREKLTADGFKQSEIKKRLLELARKNEGKNATKIIYLSYLNPRGSVVDAVAATSDGASVDKNRVAVMAEWVGHLRYDFPQLTDFHESELFDFLKNGHYGVDVKNFNDFAKRVQTAIEKHTEWGKFDADKSLNLEKNLGKSENEKRYDAELDRLKKEWADAENTLTRKLGEFKARQKKDSTITNDQILKAVQPYKDAAILAKGAYLSFRDKRGEYLRADENQMSLFGLGKPTIKLEFEDNAELLNFQNLISNSVAFESEPMEVNAEGEFEPIKDGLKGYTVNDKPAEIFNCPESDLKTYGFKPTYQRLQSYDHLIDPATGERTLVGYGFDKATLQELLNACRYYPQVARLAAHLKGDSELQSAFNIWHFLHTNVRYNYDTPGVEEIRVPARVWRDRFDGVDCDCLAVFTACLLICMGYRPKFEIVAFDNSPKYSHIFVNLNGAAIDRVLPAFLQRPALITKTKIMEIPVYQLSGVGDSLNVLNGLYDSTLRKIADGTATADDSINFRKAQVLISLSGCDYNAYRLAGILMPHVATIADDGAYYFANANVAKVAEESDSELRYLESHNATPETLNGWFSTVVQKVNTANDNAVVKNANVGKSPTIVVVINPRHQAAQVSGDLTKANLVKINPMVILLRNCIRLLIAINFAGLATRFCVGLISKKDAFDLGYSEDAWQKAVKAVTMLKSLFTQLAGDEQTLVDSIISGAQKQELQAGNFDPAQLIVETSASDAILSGTGNVEVGINGLGNGITIGSALATVGAFFPMLWAWVADVVPMQRGYVQPSTQTDSQSAMMSNATAVPAATSATSTSLQPLMNRAYVAANSADGNAADVDSESESESNLLPWLLFGVTTLIGATSLSNSKKKKK